MQCHLNNQVVITVPQVVIPQHPVATPMPRVDMGLILIKLKDMQINQCLKLQYSLYFSKEFNLCM